MVISVEASYKDEQRNCQKDRKVTTGESRYFFVLKAFVIYCVVLAHLLEYFIDRQEFYVIVSVIYTFHMPIFVFVSGFFGSFKKNRFLGVLLLYFIFSSIRMVLNYFLFENGSVITFSYVLDAYIYPQWTLWYLIAYAIWSLTFLCIKKIKVWHIIVAFLIPLVLGYIEDFGILLSLSRIFYFLPFYLIGRFASQNKDYFSTFLQKITATKRKIISIMTLIIIAVCFCIFGDYLPSEWLYGSSSYYNENAFVNVQYGALLRMLGYIVTIIASISVLSLINFKQRENEETCSYGKCENTFVQLGKNTLAVYLFHSFILSILNATGLFDYLATNYLLLILIIIVVPISLQLFFSMNFFTKVLQKISKLEFKKNKITQK